MSRDEAGNGPAQPGQPWSVLSQVGTALSLSGMSLQSWEHFTSNRQMCYKCVSWETALKNLYMGENYISNPKSRSSGTLEVTLVTQLASKDSRAPNGNNQL